MNLRIGRLATLALLVSVAACASIPLPDVAGRETPALERKTVVAKQEPQELIAADGTRCTSGAGKFERVRPGDRVWCVWQRSDRAASSAVLGQQTIRQ
ncbi:hypothetical protein BH24GEM2_BH24GEM2_07710 [soil metagenome]